MNLLYTDHLSYKLPVSIKGMVYFNDKFLLRKNEREEWELLGGKLEKGEMPEKCLERELHEEIGVHVDVDELLDAWLYKIFDDVEVLIITYSCMVERCAKHIYSRENAEIAWFSMPEIDKLNMPDGYKKTMKIFRAY